MKTARELLFARHADAQPRLDALREAFVAGLPAVRTAASKPSLRTTLWDQLVVAGRPAWMALGAAWALIFLLETTSSPVTERPAVATATPPSAEVEEILTAQRELWAELTDHRDPPPARAKEPPASPSGARLPLHRRDRLTTLV